MGQLLDDLRNALFRSRKNLLLRLFLFAVTLAVLVVFVMHSPFRQQVPYLLTQPAVEASAAGHHHQHQLAELMSPEQVFDYLHWTNCATCKMAMDFGLSIARSANPGGVAHPDGQKSVCLDQFIAPVFRNCFVYSFGINNYWTFDDDMAEFGCHVYAFDPSMGVKDFNRTQLIHFYNLGLAKENGQNPSGWNMKTADSIYQMLAGHHGNTTLIDVFKMDIEFYEWEVIPQMLQSGFLASKVKQLAVEIHFTADDPLESYQKRVRILQDLESMNATGAGGGFVRFSSRHNPGLRRSIKILGNKNEYIGFEVAWYNSRFYDAPSKPGPVFPYYL
jgi:hypothetical protein